MERVTLTVWVGQRKKFHTQPIPLLVAVQLENMLRALAAEFGFSISVSLNHASARYYRDVWKPFEKYGLQFFGKFRIEEPFVLTLEDMTEEKEGAQD